MCGFIGFLASNGQAQKHVALLKPALQKMRHRGPDESNIWSNDDIAFAFTRLAIIDIEGSHQPMAWGTPAEPERYVLAYNGEIYNYLELREELENEFGLSFTTDGDAEVLLAGYHTWGKELLPKLRGMFAFILWDTKERTLLIGRDPFGIKPLYYLHTDEGVFFSSEKKSLLGVAKELNLKLDLDKRALEHYIAFQYVPEPESMHAQIRRFNSGSWGTLQPGGQIATTRYFEPDLPPTESAYDSEALLITKIRQALEDSVEKHMRADVTVGSFLSGGIDSTAIAALAKRHNDNLLTFTTGFEREGYSEIDVAAESAAAIGVEHVVRKVTPEEFIEHLPLIMWYLDDPVADPALVPLYFVAREARKHVKVVLSGEGADELFGGYTIYKEPLSLAPFEKLPNSFRRGLGKLSERLPQGMRGKSLLKRGSLSLEDRYYGNARSFNFEQMQSVIPWAKPEWNHQDVTAPYYEHSVGWDPIARMQHIDLMTWMRGDILVKADRVTMANSLELRVPFLDKVVWEVAQELPSTMKIAHGTSKWALREALKEVVPEHVLNRRKLGFPVPIRHWLAGPEMYDWARDTITQSQTDEYVDKAAVLNMLDEHKAGVMDHSRRLWTVLCFMLWHGIFVDKTITPTIPNPDYPVEL
ncbi:MAG: asparagine synthase (glutamine-hydrolyzing) [Lawsonella sp.]